MVHTARALFICTDRDDTNVLITLTARHLSGDVRIVARVEEAENEKLVRQSGANATVLPSRVAGLLMADSLESSAVASAVMDFMSAGGHVTLVERPARPEEVGRIRRRSIRWSCACFGTLRCLRSGSRMLASELTTSSSSFGHVVLILIRGDRPNESAVGIRNPVGQ